MKSYNVKKDNARRIVIIGAGQVGKHIAGQLSSDGYNVLVLDESKSRISEVKELADVATMIGNGCDPEMYRKANVNENDVFLAVTSSDETNLLACRIAKAFNCHTKIARVRKAFYKTYSEGPIDSNFWADLGIEVLFNQEQITTLEISRLLKNPGALDTISILDEKVQLIGYRVKHDSLLIGRRLIGIKDLPMFKNLLVAAVSSKSHGDDKPSKQPARNYSELRTLRGIRRQAKFVAEKEETFIPNGKYKIKDGDLLYICGLKNDFKKIATLFDPKTSTNFKHIFILGGSILANQLAENLVKAHPRHSVYLLEKDSERAYGATKNLSPKLHILHTDIHHIEDLKNEGLDENCVFIAASKNEDDNVLASILVKEETHARTIALIQNEAYLHMVPYLDIDAAVSPKLLLVKEVLKAFRGNEYEILSVKDSNTQVLEFSVDETSDLAGSKLKDINFPKNSICLTVLRDNKIIIPDGNTEMSIGDAVVIFALKDAIKQVESIFHIKG